MSTREVAKQLEAVVLRQLLAEAKAFRGEGSGSHVYGGMFVDALANAIEAGGGLGLAATLERSLEGPGSTGPQGPSHPGAHAPPGTLEALVVGGPSQLSSRFGPRADPLTGQARFHGGLDIAAPEGAPIRAARDGVVRFAGASGDYGLMVEIDHGDGLVTRYAHASRLKARVGDRVQAGEEIAEVGATGRATGAHLHVETLEEGHRLDPERVLNVPPKRAE